MGKNIVLPLYVLLVSWCTAVHADVSVRAGLTIDSGIDGFHVAVAQHYRVKKGVVVLCRQREIPDAHLPVVFFLARGARVSPDAVVALRLQGKSWMDISGHFGLGVDAFYVPVTRVPGPPYGRALGHFKKKRSAWGSIRLTDDDVVSLVNLKFFAAHYGHSHDEVLRLHQGGGGFIGFHGRVKAHKAAKVHKAQPNKAPSRRATLRMDKHARKGFTHGANAFGGGRGKGNGGKGRGKKK